MVHEKNAGIELPNFPGIPILSLLATVMPPPTQGDRPVGSKAPTYTVILFTLIRLEKQTTDLEVILNLPNIPGLQDLGEEGVSLDNTDVKHTPAVKSGAEVLKEVLESFLIKDRGLFGPGG